MSEGMEGPEPETSHAAPAHPADPWRRFFSSKPFIALLLLALLMELVFSTGLVDRDGLADSINDDLRKPVAAISPLEIGDVFLETLNGTNECTVEQGRFFGARSCPSYSLVEKVTRVPKASLDTADFIVGEGVAGLIILGLPLILVLAVVLAGLASRDEGTPVMLFYLIVLGPAFVFILAGLLGWLLQACIIAVLFVVRQTLLSFAVITGALAIYDRFEMMAKIRSLFLALRA